MKGQVSSAAPQNGKSYVVAAYDNDKYWALPNTTTNGSTIQGVEVQLNSVDKVNTSDAAGKTWTLEEGTTAGRFYIKYTSGNSTYYLYKNGTSTSNKNFKVSTGDKNYWEFTAVQPTTSSNYTGYQVKAIDRGSNRLYIECLSSGSFQCGSYVKIILLEVGDAPIPINYTIDASADPTEGGNVDGAGTYTNGASCTLTANPASGYAFLNWTEGGNVVEGAGATYTFTVESSRTLVANFVAGYNVTATANPEAGGSITGAGSYASGSNVTLTATANTGYTFTNWTEGGTVLSTNTNYTINSIVSNHTLVANFTANNYTVNVASNDESMGTVSGGGTFAYGTSCTVTATANTAWGYAFQNWTKEGNVVSTSASYTFTVEGNCTLVANFGIPCDYVKVTASQDDWSGDYVIAYDNGATARVLSGEAGSNGYGGYVSPNQNQTDHSLAIADVSSYNIVIEKVGSNNYYTLKQGDYYLYYTGSSNSLYFGTAIGDTPNQYYWTITYSGTTMTIANVNSTTRKIRWNNGSSKRFACYLDSSNQQEISLYKKEECGPTCPVPTNLAVSSVTANSASISWTVDPDVESYNLRYRTITTSQTTAPVTEDFSNQTAAGYNASNGQLPDGWTSFNSSTSGYAPRVSNSSSYTYISALMGNFLLMTTNGTGQKTYAIMPQYNNISALSFNYAFENTSNCGALEVGYVTDNTSYSTFTTLQTISVEDTQSHSFTMSSADINTINSNDGYIAFKYNSGSANFYSVGIDDITVTYPQTIQTPGTWQPNENGSTATSPATLNNLAMNTNYEVQVQSVCDEGFESEWSEGVTFTTFTTITKTINGHNDDNLAGWYLITSPLNGTIAPTAVTNMIPTVNGTLAEDSRDYDLYYFEPTPADDLDEGFSYLEWINYKDTEHGGGFSLEAGKGYLYANKYDVTLTFTGVPYSGDGTVTITDNQSGSKWDGWNLVGNPFNSNASVSKAFYKIIRTSDGNQATAFNVNSVIAPMEGVFVKAETASDEVTFTATADPVTTLGNRSIRLSVSRANEFLDNAIVNINAEGSLCKLNFNDNTTRIYISRDSQDYAIVSSDAENELPVSFKASRNGRYSLDVNTENLEMNYLHLIDNMTGADVDLLATPSYSFEAKTSDYANRFKLVFATASVDEYGDNDFAFFSNGSLVVNNPSTGSEAATLQVIDVNGRILKSESINGCANVNLNAAPGVYMIRLVNGNNVKTQKIVVR